MNIKCLTLHKKKQKNTTMLQVKLSIDGMKKEKSKRKEQKEVIDDISLKKKKMMVKYLSYIQEFQVKSKKVIYKDKLNFLKTNMKAIKLSPTLEAELIFQEKGLTPFWTNYSNGISKKLWLPEKIDSLDSDTRFLKTCSIDSVQNSQLSQIKKIKLQKKNYQKICYPLLQSLPQDIMEKEDIILTRKIRIYPSNKQKQLFEKCFGASRYYYNKAVELSKNEFEKKISQSKELKINGCIYKIKNKQCCKEITSKSTWFCKTHINQKIKNDLGLNLISYRKKLIKSDKELEDDELWKKEIPYDTRQLAIKEYITSLKSAISNKKNGNIGFFEMKYRSKKNLRKSFNIDHRAIKPERFLFKKRLKNKIRMRSKMRKWWDKNVKEIVHDCKIINDESNRYYICLNIDNKNKKVNKTNSVVSLDPGIRTFQTFYSPDGKCGKLGDNMNQDLFPISNRIDKLTSLITKTNGKTKYNLRKRNHVLRTKIRNKVSDLHWKTANYLCNNYDIILLPTFDTQKMVKKMPTRYRKINNNTVRTMLMLSHYSFKQKLQHKCNEYNKKLIICTEEYTSKTCGRCGELNDTLGSSKTFKCPSCKLIIDRDINGSRNILIKYLTETSA